jgi:hypothetical protein
MKHKLHRDEPKTMAEFMAIADKYALADSAARVQYAESVPAAGQSQPASGQGGHHNCDHHSKRKDERHDNKYGSKQVAAVQGSLGATGGSQKRKGDKFNKNKYTFLEGGINYFLTLFLEQIMKLMLHHLMLLDLHFLCLAQRR